MQPPMKVLVCVKQIPEPSAPGKLEPQTRRLVREGVDLVLDPGDEHGVEAGLQLVEKDAGEVTVISMGPPKAIDAIRRALAMGAHRGILITDPALENSDAISTARAIAAAIKGQTYDLIVCGTESTDGSSGAVPGIMQAKNKEVKQVGLSDIGLAGQAGKAALTQEVVDATPAEARKAGEIVEDKGQGAKRVADFLKELKVI